MAGSLQMPNLPKVICTGWGNHCQSVESGIFDLRGAGGHRELMRSFGGGFRVRRDSFGAPIENGTDLPACGVGRWGARERNRRVEERKRGRDLTHKSHVPVLVGDPGPWHAVSHLRRLVDSEGDASGRVPARGPGANPGLSVEE